MLKGRDFMNIMNYEEEISKRDQIINELKEEIEILKLEVERYKKEAYYDSLTHLNNRRILENVADYDSVILGDIDYFKKINDSYGHLKGDEVLVEISRVLDTYVRDTDVVCRWGGEEFLIILKNCSSEEAYKKAMILKEKIEELKNIFGFEITMSFGISNYLFEKPVEEAINEADKALSKSKKSGRNRITMYKGV